MKCGLRAGWKVLGAVLLLAGIASTARAEEEFPLDLQNRVKDLRDGIRTGIHEGNAAQHLKDMQQAAHASVMRLTDEVNRGLKTGAGRKPTPMSQLVHEANTLIPDMPILEKQSNEVQRQVHERKKEYIQLYGQYVAAVLHDEILLPKDKQIKYEPLVRINACRILAKLGQSGYVKSDPKQVDTVDIALDVIENPKEIDAVRFYAFQALKNLLSVPNPAGLDKSLLTKQPDREKQIAVALCQFITRPATISTDAPLEEIDGWRYVRREAVRALGYVHNPIIRDEKDKKIMADPAFVLLRIAAADPTVSPTPSLYERAEALIGFLQLNPDREMEMDYASWYVAITMRDLAAEFSARKIKVPGAAANPDDKEIAQPRDYLPWKTIWNKLEILFKPWKDGWEGTYANAPRGPDQMVTDLLQICQAQLFQPCVGVATLPPNVEYESLTTWIQNQQGNVMAKTLFKDDPDSEIKVPKN
ncbi:MAG TPA: hypothetical protein VGZ47_01780 [Gemmataceae bacterium]|jgi:hypothetical protein|nr:hypothetical protein [Gemmataceae bacterium]